jgi:hypothetical protein
LTKNKTLAVLLGILALVNGAEARFTETAVPRKNEVNVSQRIPTAYLLYTAAAILGIVASLALSGLGWNKLVAD